ncbi:hypothetical protein BKI52_14585 [marine bacterium AO1-C]|nr:hypothetical protein BKI52_14585 [marine bacterium AO1-C]
MNKTITYLIIISIAVGQAAMGQSTDKDLLSRIAKKLNEVKSLECTYAFEQKVENKPSSNWQATGKMAYDFSKMNELGANVYISRKSKRGFTKFFMQDTLYDIRSKTATLIKTAMRNMNKRIRKMWLFGNLALFSSPYEMREVLPAIAKNPATKILQVSNTTIQGQEAIQIQLELQGVRIGGEGKLIEVKTPKNRYDLTVRKKDLLPLQWKVLFEGGMNVTSYANLSTTFAENYWKLSKLQSEYLVLSGKEYRARERVKLSEWEGQQMVSWELPSLKGKTQTNRSLKQKLTLYEFFFLGCIGSIKAKPHIDELKSKFGDKLQVLNIETQDASKKEVQAFVNKFKLSSPTFYNGKKLASKLGIKGCPTFILVDEKGTIVYTSFGEVGKLKKQIAARLE